MKKIIATTNAPAAIGPYSQAIDCGSFLVTSGQVPFDPKTGEFVPGGIQEQTRQVFRNIKAIVEAAGLTMDNVVKTTVFLQHMSDFAAMNALYAEFFTEGQYPARSAVEVGALPRGALVEIETICVNFLRGMEATKLSVTGHMYFVPRTFMERVDIFEDFITLLSGLNKKQTPLVVNSFYIIDDAKQRDKMTEEFYLAVKKEIAAYQEKCDYLIKSSSQSPAVMERWALKVQALEEKKRHYEGVLQRELDGLDDEFSVLKLLSQELQVRANSIRSQRFQQKAA